MRGKAHTLQTFCIIDGMKLHNKDSLFHRMNFLAGGAKFYRGGAGPPALATPPRGWITIHEIQDRGAQDGL